MAGARKLPLGPPRKQGANSFYKWRAFESLELRLSQMHLAAGRCNLLPLNSIASRSSWHGRLLGGRPTLVRSTELDECQTQQSSWRHLVAGCELIVAPECAQIDHPPASRYEQQKRAANINYRFRRPQAHEMGAKLDEGANMFAGLSREHCVFLRRQCRCDGGTSSLTSRPDEDAGRAHF